MLAHDPALLAELLRLEAAAPAIWRAGPYWHPYAARIRRELGRLPTLDGFRRNQVLLKGFALGGPPEIARPSNVVKRLVWDALERGPVVTAWRKAAAAEHGHGLRASIGHARLALEHMAARHEFDIPPGIAAGDAEDAFEWQGQIVTAHFVMYLARALDLRAAVGPVQRLLEIGPGLGLSTLAWKAVWPDLQLIVNVDIPEVLYLSERFLTAAGHSPVVGLDPRTLPDRGLLLVPPWLLPEIAGRFDVACNAASFQEMPAVTVSAYGQQMRRLSSRIALHTYQGGEWVPRLLGGDWAAVNGTWPDLFAPGNHALVQAAG